MERPRSEAIDPRLKRLVAVAPATMATARLVAYLGTRGCPGVLEEAARDHFGPIAVAVPTEPLLLGPHLDGSELEAGLAAVAEILAERAGDRARSVAQRDEQALAGVFAQDADARDRVETHLVDPPTGERLAELAADLEAEACFLARDALELLDDVGIRPGEHLEPRGIELRTR